MVYVYIEVHCVLSGVMGGGGVRGGAECPQRLPTGKFLLTYWEKRDKEKMKKGENGEEKKENCKREGEKLKMEGGEVTKWGYDLFVCVCGGGCVCVCVSHFSKPLKFVLGLQKWKFSTGKKHSTPGKKSGKMTLPPQKKNFPVTPLCILGRFRFIKGEQHPRTTCDAAHQKGNFAVKTCRATRNPEFPWTRPKPVRGRGTFFRIFLGRVGEFYSGRSGSGYFFTRVWDIFPRISGINLNLN